MFSAKYRKNITRLKETIQNQNKMIDNLNRSVIESHENVEQFRNVNADLFSQNEKLKKEINDLSVMAKKDVEQVIDIFSPLLGALGIDTERYMTQFYPNNVNNIWCKRAMALLADFIKGKTFRLDGIDASSSIINTNLKTIRESLAGSKSISEIPESEKEALKQLSYLVMTINSMVSKEVLQARNDLPKGSSAGQCPLCQKGSLKETTEVFENEKKGFGSCSLVFSVCDACGSEQTTDAQARKNKAFGLTG